MSEDNQIDKSFSSGAQSQETASQEAFTASNASSGGSGRDRMSWKVTEGTLHGEDDRGDTLVNMFNTLPEANDVVQDLRKNAQGIGRQFTARPQFKPVPEVRHWKGVTKAGVVEYYETWEAAKEASKKDRELRITMVEGSMSVEARVAQ